jgi:hypothetical protein
MIFTVNITGITSWKFPFIRFKIIEMKDCGICWKLREVVPTSGLSISLPSKRLEFESDILERIRR